MISHDHLQISGKVTDKRGELRYVLKGYWGEKIEYSEVLGGTEKNLNLDQQKLYGKLFLLGKSVRVVVNINIIVTVLMCPAD